MGRKEELHEEQLGSVAGGAKQNQNNSGNSGQQMNNQNGDNNNKIIQQNEIKNNNGDVTVGSPVSIETGNNSTTNINIG